MLCNGRLATKGLLEYTHEAICRVEDVEDGILPIQNEALALGVRRRRRKPPVKASLTLLSSLPAPHVSFMRYPRAA